MRTCVAVALVLMCCHAAVAADTPQVKHRTLAQASFIQNYPCAKGHAWFYPDGKLRRCVVSAETPFGESRAPSGSYITLTASGHPLLAQFSRDVEVKSTLCMGGSLLGAAEASATTFYPSGKLKACFLAGDQDVQGVPCARGGFWRAVAGQEAAIEFHESGKLKSCRLSKDFRNLPKGATFDQQP